MRSIENIQKEAPYSEAARLITCTVPTMGGSMGYEMILTDEGKIYFKHEKGIFVTNDDKYEDLILPEHK